MRQRVRLLFAGSCMALSCAGCLAQSFTWYSSTEGNTWKTSSVKMTKNVAAALLTVDENVKPIVEFKDWGITFNELDWDALGLLTRDEQDEILKNVFSSDGDLRITRGRISMNANDYARSWYSCDEVEGDLELRYFNIDRDKQTIIPFIRAAQKYNPDLTFWISPWSPPGWMKINGDYPVLSSRFNNMPEKMNYILYGNAGGQVDPDEMKLTGERKGKFPR